MQAIAHWLEKLGLGRVRAALCRERYRCLGASAPDRSGPQGPRRSAWASAKDVGGDRGACRCRPSTAAACVDESKPKDTAERRQVTVMFSDLVGSTALSARMDPEDLREVISAYQKCVAETVQRFGGFVAKYMGDGVLVYFGYPQAHEDDAERAVRAGLELIQAVSGLRSSAPLQTRIGVATGLVVVGDLIGSGRHRSAASLARRRTLRPVCRGLPSRTRSSSQRAHENCSEICSNCKTSGPGKSRASPNRCGLMRHYGRVRSRAASRRCTGQQ